jgi:hypothetical protein
MSKYTIEIVYRYVEVGTLEDWLCDLHVWNFQDDNEECKV